MRKYELTYLVSDEVPESDINKVTGKVTGLVDGLGGKITKEDIWGRRKLAYAIRKQEFATYITLYFDLPAKKASEFEKDLRHIDGILRQLMIVKDLGDEAISLSADEIAGATDIKDVIGGERSFETVEGETEESRSLMAKREEEAEKTEEEVEVPKAKPEEVKAEEEQKEIKTEETKEEKKKAKSEEPKAEKAVKVKAEKPVSEKKPVKKKEAKVVDEVERLSKLNEELDDILKDEL